MSVRVVASFAQTVPGGTTLRQQATGNDAPRLHNDPWTNLVLHTSVNHATESIDMVADLAHSWLTCSAPVAAAQVTGRPLAGLQSTIIACGMPAPENIRTAREVKALIRDVGAEPATIALIGGRIHIGVSDDELELPGLGPCTEGQPPRLASLSGRNGVFVTGGFGGVHQGAQETFDISADLQ